FQAETLRVHATYLQDQLSFSASLIETTQTRFSHEIHTSHQHVQTCAMPIKNNPIRLKPLPQPDRLEITPSVCLLTDDGTATTTHVAEALQTLGWSVVILQFPPSIIAQQTSVIEDVSYIMLKSMEEKHLQEQLAALSNSIGSFIYLHPPFLLSNGIDACFSETEKSLIKSVFFMAKYLKDTFTPFDQNSRHSFMTVARLNGQLGLGKETTYSPLAGGLFGLTKSLNLEWPSVFCRAVDLAPSLNAHQMASCLIDELYDPDLQTVEVAVGPEGRFSLILQEQE
ncbi:MAG: polyketide synthase, partial [Candidatus Latescibacteria bacterium]|nr:polyketide synthase [Candidatus Latescibacterota bacterium]